MPTPQPRHGAMMVPSSSFGVFDSVDMGYRDSIARLVSVMGMKGERSRVPSNSELTSKRGTVKWTL